MTIKSSKNYDQHAHDQPTQASAWADENQRVPVVSDTTRVNQSLDGMFGGGMGEDTRKLMHAAAAGEAPWHHSYNSTGHVSRGAIAPSSDGLPAGYARKGEGTIVQEHLTPQQRAGREANAAWLSGGAANNADPSYPHYGSQDASIRRGYQPGNEAHNVELSRQHMAMNNPDGGGGLRPKRLTGEEMDQISPGWTDERMKRAQRSDGQN